MTKNVNVRLDDDLHAQLKAAAEADDRSLNGEIAWLLKAGLALRQRHARWSSGLPDEELGEYLSAIDLPPLRGQNDPK